MLLRRLMVALLLPPTAEGDPDPGAGGCAIDRLVLEPFERQTAERSRHQYPVQNFRRSRVQRGARNAAQQLFFAGLESLQNPAIQLLVDHEVTQSSGRD